MIEMPLRVSLAAHRAKRPLRHRWLPSTTAAMLLHAVGAIVLASIALPTAPAVPEAQTIAMVFAAPRPPTPAPVAPTRTPAETPPAAAPPTTPTPAAAPPDIATPTPAPTAAPTPATIPPQATEPTALPPPLPRAHPHPHPPPVTRTAAPLALPTAPAGPAIAASQAPVTPQPGASPAPAPTESQIPSDWQRALAVWLADHKTYPDDARRQGTEGSVVLRLTADQSGRVLDVVLLRSAGSAVLDAATQAMVRNATLPRFTPEMPSDRVTITIRIRYALGD